MADVELTPAQKRKIKRAIERYKSMIETIRG